MKALSLKCERSFSYNYLHHQALLYKKKCKEEPDDVNNFTKSFAHILNLKFYCPY